MSVRRTVLRLVATLALLCAALGTGFAAELPALTGRVVDAANVIDDATEARLTQTLAAFEAKSSDQLVVATIPSLDGEAIEPYANRLFRAWQLGQAGENNGVLLLVAPNDRRMRIEVGYGLEGTLTDLHSKLIIENVLVPAFRAGDFGPGIEAATDDIIGVLSGDAAELEARYQRNLPESSGSGMPIFVVLFIIVWATIFFGSIFMAVLVPRYGRKVGRNRYVWNGMTFDFNNRGSSGSSSSSGSGWSSGGSSSSSGGGFSGGGGSSGGGGASGSW